MLSTASRRNFLLVARSLGNASVISSTLVLMMISPHSIMANAPGLHRNSENGSIKIDQPSQYVRGVKVHRPRNGETDGSAETRRRDWGGPAIHRRPIP